MVRTSPFSASTWSVDFHWPPDFRIPYISTYGSSSKLQIMFEVKPLVVNPEIKGKFEWLGDSHEVRPDDVRYFFLIDWGGGPGIVQFSIDVKIIRYLYFKLGSARIVIGCGDSLPSGASLFLLYKMFTKVLWQIPKSRMYDGMPFLQQFKFCHIEEKRMKIGGSLMKEAFTKMLIDECQKVKKLLVTLGKFGVWILVILGHFDA